MRRYLAPLLLVCLTGFVSRLAAAQAMQYAPMNDTNKQTGIDPSSVGSFTESVSLYSGDIHIEKPLLSLPGVNGLDLDLSVYWDSKQYDIETWVNPYQGSQACGGTLNFQLTWANRDSIAGGFAGGTLSIPRLLYTQGGFIGAAYFGAPAGNCNGPAFALFGNNRWIYIDEHGSKHAFRIQRDYDHGTSGPGYTQYDPELMAPVLIDDTTDGSMIRMDTTAFPIVKVMLPNGNQVIFDTTKNIGSTAADFPAEITSAAGSMGQTFVIGPTTIQDRDGNKITFDANGITDTVGRRVTYSNGGYTYLSSNGKPVTITATSETPIDTPQPITLHAQGCSASNGYGGSTNYDSVLNPTFPASGAQQYAIMIQSGSESVTSHIGLDALGEPIRSIYSTGGTAQYSYTAFSTGFNLGGVAQCTGDHRILTSKTVCTASSGQCSNPDVTTYTPNMPGDVILQNTVTMPADINGNRSYTIHKFSSSQFEVDEELERDDFDFNGNPLKSTVNTYQMVDLNYSNKQSTKVTYLDITPNLSTTTTYQYQTYLKVCPPSQTVYGGWQVYCWSSQTLQPQMSEPYITTVTGFDGTTMRQETEPYYSGGSTLYTDDGSHIFLDHTSSNASGGATYVYQEDTKGNVVEVDRTGPDIPAAHETTPPDSRGVPLSLTDWKGNQTTYSFTNGWYDSECPTAVSSARPSMATNALGQSTTFSYYSCTGKLAKSTDPNGVSTLYQYDDLGRLSIKTLASGSPQEAESHWFYPSNNEVDLEVDETVAGDGLIKSKSILDGIGRTIHNTQPNGAVVDTTYDGLGRQSSVSNPYLTQSDSTYGLTSYQYDALGRRIRVTEPDGNTLKWTYSGSKATSTDEAGNSWVRTADALERLIGVMEPGQLSTSYSYDSLGDLKTVTQSGLSTDTPRIRIFTYDSMSRLVKSQDPEAGLISYQYDPDSNMTSKTDARGVALAYSYDTLNRRTSQSASDGSVADTYYYDNTSEGSSGIGRLYVANHNNVASNGFYYDKLGRLWATSYAEPGSNGWQSGMNITYNLANSPILILYPDGRQVSQTFDMAGQLASVTSGGVNYLSGVSYTPTGAESGFTLGNGISQTNKFNNRLQSCRTMAYTPVLTVNPNGGNLLDRESFYHSSNTSNCGNEASNNGKMYSILDNRNANWSQKFGYDALNRLTSASRQDSASPVYGGYNHLYQYDSFGNIQVMDQLHTNPTWAIDPKTNQLLMNPLGGNSLDAYGHPANTYEYDLSGNMVSSGTNNIGAHQYTYNALGQLMTVDAGNTASYDYNGLDERAFKSTTSGWTDYVFMNGQPMAELSSTGIWTDYIYANGQKIAKVVSSAPFLDLHGVRTSGNGVCGIQGAVSGVPAGLAGLVIATGDSLVVDMQQTLPTYGGLALIFTNGTGTGTAVDAPSGYYLFSFGATDGKWHHLSGSLSSWVGLTVSYALAGIHQNAATGTFDLLMANAAVLHANGSITPIYTGQVASVAGFSGTSCGGSQLSSGTALTPVTDPTMATNYYVDDHLGTAQMEINGGGWPVWEGQFTPFGLELADGNTAMHYKFTGKERDSESGLDDFGIRYYGSSVGRFMSPDPTVISRELNNPQSWNKYSYTFNRPLSLVDPDGKWPYWFHTQLDRDFFGKQLHFSYHDQDLIVEESASQDGFLNGGQSPSNSVMHDMRNGFTAGNATGANAQTNAYIFSELSKAVNSELYSEWSASNSMADGPVSYSHDDALIHLANAIHAAQDSTSPEHDGKPWYGIWQMGIGPPVKHAIDEWLSSIGGDASSEAARAEAAHVTAITYSEYLSLLDSTRKRRSDKNGHILDPAIWR